MPSERPIISYRPDEEERAMVNFLAKKFGASASRAVGMAVRRVAEQEGYTPEKKSDDEEK
jgi:hypothetical protein